MAAGDPGTKKRNYSATAIETKLLASIPSAAANDATTGVVVVSISGFPTTFPYTLILDPDTSKEEVVTVTSGSTTTLVITRGQDGTTAFAHAAGTSVRHGVSAREFKELQTHIAARGVDTDTALLSGVDTHVHGILITEGDVVGTAKAQTLTNKIYSAGTFTGSFTASAATFASPTITSPTISGSPVITGLSSASMSASSAAPKSYVDAILILQEASAASSATSASAAATSATSAAASATAAATSATSAATSATSAAASATTAAASVATIAGYATSSANSASAAATSATSAAASATSSASSASAAATSATSAAASATAATTSATSAAASATAAATSATSAAASATAAATSATSAAASATTAAASVATISASATAAASSETAAATSATSAAASATAAATSATSAAASATTASNSAATATTQAGNASASATAAATSATAAATSATAAATSATSAANSATASASSASAAATSATSAAASATSAADSYDEFDDRYLGSKTSDPTLDNDGNALLTGALYFNSVVGALKVYNGATWALVAPDTTNFIDKAILTAKGTIISASTASTPVALTVAATNGYLLSVSSSTTSGLAWTAPPVDIFSLNLQTLTSNYTIDAGYNAHSVGPVTIDTGITITIPSGATWLID